SAWRPVSSTTTTASSSSSSLTRSPAAPDPEADWRLSTYTTTATQEACCSNQDLSRRTSEGSSTPRLLTFLSTTSTVTVSTRSSSRERPTSRSSAKTTSKPCSSPMTTRPTT